MPSVGWDGRDVSGLSHDQIHRWTRDGASPEALAAARDRHLARADELRGAADRLQTAQRGVGETWVGRDSDAAGTRTRVLAQRMEQLAQTVGGQARGIDGMRAALLRVQAAVGPPRPPALPSLGVTPVLDELRALVTGRPADGYGGFRAAAADQAAAREAYRAYLGETATAARAVGGAGAGPAPAPGVAPAATPAAAGRTPLPPGARGASSGVLQRAAVPTPGAIPTAGAVPSRPVGGGAVGGGATGGAEVPVRAAGVAPGGPVAGGAGPNGPGVVGGGGLSGANPGRAMPVGPGGVGPGGAGPGSAAQGGAAQGGAAGPGAAGGGGFGVGAAGGGRGLAGRAGGVGGGPGSSAPPGPTPSTSGPARSGPSRAGGGAAEPGPTRRRDGDGGERAPSVVGGPPGAPGGLDDHGAGDVGEAEDVAEEVVVPVRHVTWLVDPDPAGWGAGGRRVVPPVLGEGPGTAGR